MSDTETKQHAFDWENPPEHWTITQVGKEYMCVHDGVNDDGTVSGGAAFRCSDLSALPELLKVRGKLPVGHKLNPRTD